ncbi:uncharacterized protein LOC133631485 isoform X2 [Entelurus aequoreus]|uniref:uncharacterized protein LOC133631485 isoform X2 n=1 Tax=Entelurus aequoreus TaxID=161455 RepID=UPI002B1DD341|nr:uncharacterized protein LOC133631485 isoform X2 [Entelurus aequoreus]
MKVEMRKVHATLQDGMVGSWTPPNTDFQLTLAELVPHQREAVEAKMRGMAYRSEVFALKTAKKTNRAEMASSLKTFKSAKRDALNTFRSAKRDALNTFRSAKRDALKTFQFSKRALNAELSVLNCDLKFLKAERAHQIELAQLKAQSGGGGSPPASTGDGGDSGPENFLSIGMKVPARTQRCRGPKKKKKKKVCVLTRR